MGEKSRSNYQLGGKLTKKEWERIFNDDTRDDEGATGRTTGEETTIEGGEDGG